MYAQNLALSSRQPRRFERTEQQDENSNSSIVVQVWIREYLVFLGGFGFNDPKQQCPRSVKNSVCYE